MEVGVNVFHPISVHSFLENEMNGWLLVNSDQCELVTKVLPESDESNPFG